MQKQLQVATKSGHSFVGFVDNVYPGVNVMFLSNQSKDHAF
ncbi:hypothetical protein Cpin_6509 [Chitinophaga pinensis DSM 2588]|uniref:Uncharacterized protein n=1 Tax=Chitinophaga pinensis (strain ATCC 43595 / DSM 2588 / LMG 13176 / NBRC 15968 / NCIMB 11800 / UQM 2034) TaxID=485918 RepID=A0A979GAQ6_CHIPD|nr:hypothetical protein Cpin_6509 [Chitinophaga pinensis DSM 2588]